MSAEQWRPIPLAPGYEVSDRGRIRSFRRGAPACGRLLSLAPSAGYRVVRIHHDGSWRVRRVHQLVLEAFVGPCPNDADGVRHLNDVKDDNRLTNLAWGTYAENMRDRVANGIHHYSSRTHCKQGHEFTEANTYVAPGKPNTSACRQCHLTRSAEHKARLRARVIETRELRAA
jgi:hypothetical protein